MTHVATTIAILLIALGLYALGMGISSSLLVACGAGFELWFWVRAMRRRPPEKGNLS